jgi:polyhydroxybutyrate depolymerase
MRMLAKLVLASTAVSLLLGACSNTATNSGVGAATSGSGGSGTSTAGTNAGGSSTATPCVGGATTGGSANTAAGSSSGAGASTAGSGGSTGQSGAGGGGPVPAKPSAGCNKAATETPAEFVKHSLMSSGASRDFYSYLPTGYDPKRAYPTIFAFTPCGGSGNPSSNVPIQNESKDKAIIISPQSKGNCYENQIRNSPELPFFDATLKYAEDNYCVDENRVFAIGYSAGSWMSIILGCERADVVRAHAQVSGGLPIFERPSDCKGSVASLYIHDNTDGNNTIGGGLAARDRSLRMAGCSDSTQPWDPTPCKAYDGCKPGYPVVWCETTGKGHDRQDNLAPGAFWKFFSQF